MAKQTNKIMNITALKVDYDTNVRLRNNYDLPSMKSQILEAKRILKPIVVNGDKDNLVLQGNRRTLAAQELYNDPQCPQEVKDALSKVQVIVYTGLDAKEEVQLIMDHGGEKPISKTEVVQSVWRLDKQFYSESQIGVWMLHALASYTGNIRKVNELPAEPKQREAAIKKWLHGTLGNYILAASKLGEFIREQFILTHKSDDKLLMDGEKVTMWCSRERISALNTARGEDIKAQEWDSEKGGPRLNALIEQYVKEDQGEKPDKVRPLTQKDMQDKADQFSSAAVKAAFLTASGKPDAGRNLHELDTRMYRLQLVFDTLAKEHSKLTNPHMAEFIRVLLNDALPAAAIADALKPFQG